MASTWTRTITASADTTGLTRQDIREAVVEDWLAETNSNFQTDAVLNGGINWAYRKIAKAMGGVDARWDIDSTITAPFELPLPRDMQHFERAAYNPNGPTGADVTELVPLSYAKMFGRYGREWIDDGSGTPEIIWVRGWRTFGLYPRTGSTTTDDISVFGRSAYPTLLTSDTDRPVTPAGFDDVIAAGAFVYALRRTGQHNGVMAQHYQEALMEWTQGLQEAQKFSVAIQIDPKIAGVVSRIDLSNIRAWEPVLDF